MAPSQDQHHRQASPGGKAKKAIQCSERTEQEPSWHRYLHDARPSGQAAKTASDTVIPARPVAGMGTATDSPSHPRGPSAASSSTAGRHQDTRGAISADQGAFLPRSGDPRSAHQVADGSLPYALTVSVEPDHRAPLDVKLVDDEEEELERIDRLMRANISQSRRETENYLGTGVWADDPNERGGVAKKTRRS